MMTRLYVCICILLAEAIQLSSCTQKLFPTNGETIYRTGRNLNGDKMIDRAASTIPFVNSCSNCHGKKGNSMKMVSVQFSYLASSDHFSTPYTDSLFYRFIDHDLKSDGTKANIGVIWKMSDKDKKDLLEYLKSL